MVHEQVDESSELKTKQTSREPEAHCVEKFDIWIVLNRWRWMKMLIDRKILIEW